MQNKMKINDWSAIQAGFDELNKRLERYTKAADNVGIPKMYIKMMVELEDFLTSTLSNREVKKKMSTTNAKALNSMRQRLKKNNTPYAEQLMKFRENPEEESEEEEEESSSSSEDEGEDGEEKEEVVDKRAGALGRDRARFRVTRAGHGRKVRRRQQDYGSSAAGRSSISIMARGGVWYGFVQV
jgi:translation initiation factor 3 subunit C